ncbi:MAG: translation initiation factor [Bacteroidetes bacterium HGW-Bacteroidetes-21]|jgi:translation initiation factor 1|nr:MAG: translation initiation factor [Bacteroidetes bacterium HGW-Bacteroidetes-21]
MGKDKDKKGIVYSTNPDFKFASDESENTIETLPPQQQNLIVMLDKRNRSGKAVTLVTRFVGTEEDLNDLGKFLKTRCGVGGTVKEGEIMIQGDFRQKITQILLEKGYKVKISGM